MPNLTRLERTQDVCWSQWQTPAGRTVSEDIQTPITPKEIEAWLGGADPPRPVSIPATWVHKESRLERMYTNGQQAIGPNELGDVSGYLADGVKAPELYVVVIQEPGDNPIEITIAPADVVKNQDGTVSTGKDIEATTTTKAGTVPTYRIVNDVATKVRER